MYGAVPVLGPPRRKAYCCWSMSTTKKAVLIDWVAENFMSQTVFVVKNVTAFFPARAPEAISITCGLMEV